MSYFDRLPEHLQEHIITIAYRLHIMETAHVKIRAEMKYAAYSYWSGRISKIQQPPSRQDVDWFLEILDFHRSITLCVILKWDTSYSTWKRI
jgi:hypothetical protein